MKPYPEYLAAHLEVQRRIEAAKAEISKLSSGDLYLVVEDISDYVDRKGVSPVLDHDAHPNTYFVCSHTLNGYFAHCDTPEECVDAVRKLLNLDQPIDPPKSDRSPSATVQPPQSKPIQNTRSNPMKVNPNNSDRPSRQTQPQNEQRRAPSADPFAGGKPKGSLILTTSRMLENTFSHKGMFWLGVSVAIASFIANCFFYFSLMIAAGLVPFTAGLSAFGISFGTSLFEVMPVVWQRSRRNNLNLIFSAGAKPDVLPVLNNKVVGDSKDLIDNYRNSDRDTARFFKTMRWLAIGAESFLAIIFLGNIGTGIRAVFRLLLFVASIFGVEWGVSLALRAASWELPPAIRDQLDELMNNAGRALNLKKLD